MSNERKPSEIIEDFIDLIERSHKEYLENKKAYEQLDNKTLVWAHDFEFAPDKAARNRLGTAYQKERKKRREYKDNAELYKNIHEFACSENNKPILKRLSGTLAKQKEKEAYLFSERVYKKDGDDGGDTPRGY